MLWHFEAIGFAWDIRTDNIVLNMKTSNPTTTYFVPQPPKDDLLLLLFRTTTHK